MVALLAQHSIFVLSFNESEQYQNLFDTFSDVMEGSHTGTAPTKFIVFDNCVHPIGIPPIPHVHSARTLPPENTMFLAQIFCMNVAKG